MEGVKKYYSDLSFIGKHFLVGLEMNTHLKRHYTICNCMKREVYEEYLRVLKQGLETDAGSKITFNKDYLSEFNQRDIIVSIKNYNQPKGLSKAIHEATPDEVFTIQGPLGKGLGIQPSGVHIAFTAGTGILVFVDLVAHLIRKNLNLLPIEEHQLLQKDFKFVLFVSFPNRKDSVALELVDGLVELC